MLSCKILLFQDNDSLEITIKRSSGAAWSEVFTQWGQFSSFENESSGGIPPKRKLWLYALAKWELWLMDGGGMVEKGVGTGGGGLKFGELTSIPPAVILHNSCITSRGVEPINLSKAGFATVKNPFEIGKFGYGPCSWRLLSYQAHGSNKWKDAD